MLLRDWSLLSWVLTRGGGGSQAWGPVFVGSRPLWGVGKGSGKEWSLSFPPKEMPLSLWRKGISGKMFCSFRSCHGLSVVAKILIIVLLSYLSLAALASSISVYVWSPWFISVVPKHNQRKPLFSLTSDACLHKSQLYPGIVDSQTPVLRKPWCN